MHTYRHIYTHNYLCVYTRNLDGPCHFAIIFFFLNHIFGLNEIFQYIFTAKIIEFSLVIWKQISDNKN